MKKESSQKPECFGDLETVFPLDEDGLRHTPGDCLECREKTNCLKSALDGPRGIRVKEEVLDRSYKAGITGFWERWSRKKALDKIKKRKLRNS